MESTSSFVVSEGIHNFDNDQNETSREYEKKEYNMHNEDMINQDQSDMPSIVDEKNIPKGSIVEPNTTEAVLDIASKARVSSKQFADCMIIDFAGHKEYYSTHQTFLTKNAIYLVLLSLKEEYVWANTSSETGW